MDMQHLLENPATWVSIAFFIFLFFAFKPVAKAISGALDKRSERIRSELSEAERLREEAQCLLASYQRRQREAEAEAAEIVNHARDEAALVLKEAEQQLENVLNKRIQQAMQKIAQAEESAAREVQDKMLELAGEITLAVLKTQLTPTKQHELMQDAITQLPKTLKAA